MSWRMRGTKHLMFRYYGMIAILALLAILVLIIVAPAPVDWEVIVSAVVAILSFVYFVQKQKLEETRLFEQLFREFNQRYDCLNESLNHILSKDPDEELTRVEIDVLYNYFNLCGEEYQFFEQGYIYPEVWKAWCNGMKIFCSDPRIKELWLKEMQTGSYYGLRLD